MKSPEQIKKDREQQRIQNNLERFYNPDKFYKKQDLKKRQTRLLSKIFVQGIPYSS